VERAADPGRPALPVGDLALYLSNEVQEREAARADALEQRRRDDQAVDLVRALEDAVDARVAIVALDRILRREAIAAERLQRLVRDEVHRLGAEHLQDRRLDRVLLDRLLDDPARRVGRRGVDRVGRGIHEAGRPVAHAVRDVDARRHVGELPLDHAERGDREADLLALPRVVERDLEALLRRPDGAGAELEAADVEDVERDLVALPDLAQDRVGADRYVLQDQLAGRRAADAELL